MSQIYSMQFSRNAAGQFQLETRAWYPRHREELFSFFGDAFNLERITPPWLHFHVLSAGPLDMRARCLIDYRLRLHGIPFRWRTEITEWDPPYRFVDRQMRGPYREWIHEHTFEEGEGGTWVTDKVRYAVAGGRLIN